jgi:transposase
MRSAGEKANRTNGTCGRCRTLEGRVERLERENAELRKRLEEAQRSGKRQAAPFSKGPPKRNPKKPGRKPGRGYGKHHARAVPQKVDRVVDVPFAGTCCPDCGGALENERVEKQFVTDIPPVEPTVTQFNVHCANCCHCGRHVQGRHPEQISDALGAAANQIGPNAIAFAVDLNKSVGASDGKIARFFYDAFGLSLNRSTLRRAFLRTAMKAGALYEEINAIVRCSPVVYPDETGWKVAGLKEWLWTFVTEEATLYVIRPSRGGDVAEEVLGADYSGIMGHDGWAPYDNFVHARHQQCLAHLLRRCHQLLEVATAGAVRFPRQIKALLEDALALRDRRDAGGISPHGLAVAAGRLQSRLERLLAWTRSNESNERFAKHLYNHRDQIFTFLRHPVEATNWPAEQAIRPAVVNRKMSAGNRSPSGAWAQAVLTSVLRTARQRGLDAVKLLVDLLRSPDPQHFAVLALGP